MALNNASMAGANRIGHMSHRSHADGPSRDVKHASAKLARAAGKREVTVMVDGNLITGRVYYVRANGWLSVESAAGRIASGPEVNA